MRLSLFLAALTAVIPCGAFQQEAQAPQALASISGKAVTPTGEPLPKVTVHLRSAGPRATANDRTESTDTDGKFAIEGIAAGTYFLYAERSGYARLNFGTRMPNGPPQPFTLASGEMKTGVMLSMTPQATISGKATDQDGDPSASMQVLIYRKMFASGTRQLVQIATASIFPDGNYMAANLEPGRYYVAARNFPAPTDREITAQSNPADAPQRGYFLTFYPNTTDPAAAAPIDVKPGDEIRSIDIRAEKGNLYRIRGSFTGIPQDRGGGAIAPLQLIPKDTMPQGILSIMHDDSFLFDRVPPGNYVLQSNFSANQGILPFAAYLPVTVTNQDLDLTVPLIPLIQIEGTARLEGTESQTAQPVSAGIRLIGRAIQQATVQLDGTFQLANVPPDEYRWFVSGIPPAIYVKVVRFGGRDVTHSRLDLTTGVNAPLEIVLSSNAAGVFGTVRDENNNLMPNVPVSLWSSNFPMDSPQTRRTDNDGNFLFQNLAPGEYRVAAWEEIDDGVLVNPDFRAQFEKDAAKVTLQDGTLSSADLKLIKAEAIEAAEANLP